LRRVSEAKQTLFQRTETFLRLAPEPLKVAAKRAAEPFDRIQRQRYRRATGYEGPIPPAVLRARVGAGLSVAGFFETGAYNASWVADLAAEHGMPLERAGLVYDWGCGCGRMLLPLREKVGPETDLGGSDVDADAVAWIQQACPDLKLAVNGFSPPLPLEDSSVDCLISSSIFTHLNENDQDLWLDEVIRVLAPGGLALVSVGGNLMHKMSQDGQLPTRGREMMERLARMPDLDSAGFIFEPYDVSGTNEQDFPGISGAYGLTFHSDGYLKTHWGDRFEILDHRPAVVNDVQDLLVLRAKPHAEPARG
jgi:SAM-dependent methyltransferase